MTAPIRVPRINSNDDTVTLVSLKVGIGDPVRAGMVIAEIETDKSVVEVEAPASGFVIGIFGQPGEQVAVGTALIWLGATPEAKVPAGADSPGRTGEEGPVAGASQPDRMSVTIRPGSIAGGDPSPGLSARARLRLRRLQVGGVPPAARMTGIPAPGERESDAATVGQTTPDAPGILRPLSAEHRAMVDTVSWHRDHAMAGYIETQYDVAAWAAFAEDFKTTHRLMLSPLLALMAWRLARLVAAAPACNATLVAGQRYDYQIVNLGFTVQAGESLYLVCVRDAGARDASEFVAALGELTRRALARKLAPEEMRGVTVGFSSMARWHMSRHVPVLAPHTALMIGHTIGRDGVGVLGATYDHRLLNGAQVATLLNRLARPEQHTPHL